MVASWLAERLRRRGFELEGRSTALEVERWGSPDATLVGWSRSAERLRACGRAKDVDFVVAHVDDLDVVCVGGELSHPIASRRCIDVERQPPPPAWGRPLPALGV
jgi:phosphosulfolactate phosphohydrolase-like enzyme